MVASRLLLFVAVCSGSLAVAQQDVPNFASFVQSFGRSYAASEYAQRQSLYEARVAAADAQNKRTNKLWTAGVNEFWDWNPKELTSLLGWVEGARPEGSMGGSKLSSIQKTDFMQKANKTLPVEKSWNHLKSLQGVKSQGGCGSCWAVAAVTTLESNAEINGKARTFSAQEIVNCVPNPQECGGNGGCQGATVELAMYHMMQRGLATEADEPYHAADGPCKNPSAAVSLVQNIGKGANKESLSLTVDELTTPGVIQVPLQFAQDSIGLLQWSRLPANEDGPLQDALLQGTVAVSVAGSAWSGYGDGIFDSCSKNAVIDHAVVAIGFGKDGEHKYWTIRNSWGPNWGEDGNIRLLRTDTPVCGTDSQPDVGTGCRGGPASVEVCGTCGVLYDSVYAKFR